MKNAIETTEAQQQVTKANGLDGLKVVIAGIIEKAEEAASTSSSCS